jgi:hypothetical protein
MRRRRFEKVVACAAMRTLLFAIFLCACGGAAPPVAAPEAEPPPPAIQSNDILARDAVTQHAVVKHILISWSDLASNYPSGAIDPRGKARSRAEADALAVEILGRVRAGEDIDKLMMQYSEDAGSAKHALEYDVGPDSKMVFEFKRLSQRLNVGEAGMVMTTYGWHIIKRTE